MTTVLVYTFRTFPYISDLKNLFSNVFVLGKLKLDLTILLDQIRETKPDLVVGIAKSEEGTSHFEEIAVNQFNRTTKVVDGAQKHFALFVPKLRDTAFGVSMKPTTSFCNYSVYFLKHALEREDVLIPVSFVHCNKKDLEKLPNILRL